MTVLRTGLTETGDWEWRDVDVAGGVGGFRWAEVELAADFVQRPDFRVDA
jgi:hypothetical protein